MIRKYAIIVAAGSGIRMGSSIPKQFLLLREKPLVWYSVSAFLDAFEDLEVILVLPEGYQEEGKQISESFPEQKRIHLTVGGKTRFH
jgi:2-C-methyl-D-erythritol 4-phosphate cytidylyltransferase